MMKPLSKHQRMSSMLLGVQDRLQAAQKRHLSSQAHYNR